MNLFVVALHKYISIIHATAQPRHARTGPRVHVRHAPLPPALSLSVPSVPCVLYNCLSFLTCCFSEPSFKLMISRQHTHTHTVLL